MLYYRNIPIVLQTLAHTGKPMGDDGKGALLPGYRGFGFLVEDAIDPDPLVDLEKAGFHTLPVYADGHNDLRVTGGRYRGGIGGQPVVLLRRPGANALQVFRQHLNDSGFDLLALDGYRPVEVQRRGFAYLVREMMKSRFPGMKYQGLTVREQFAVGLAADDVFAYVNPKTNDWFHSSVKAFKISNRAELEAAARALPGKSVQDIAEEVVTYRANLGINNVELDADAPMAHRGGGALDLFPLDLATGEPALLGVPFDYPCPAGVELTPSALHFFEDRANWAIYREIVARDPLLQEYLRQNSIITVTDGVCREIREIRRVLFHACYAAGWTHYINECFHFNAPNLGGKQEALLPGGGNTCQSLLRNVRDVRTGVITGNWSPAVADRLAAEFFAK